jgi:hypothetical protein
MQFSPQITPTITGCWVDLFDRPAFSGKIRRLFGPANYACIVAPDDPCGFEVQSAVIGPGCLLIGYASAARTMEPVILEPGDSYAQLGRRFSLARVDSLFLACRSDRLFVGQSVGLRWNETSEPGH